MKTGFIQFESDNHVFHFNADHVVRIEHRKGAKSATVYFTNGSTTTIPVTSIATLTGKPASNAEPITPANGHGLAVRRA